MKLGVLSDTHDNLANLRKAVEIFLQNGVEAVLHAGDFCSPFTLPVFQPLAEKGVTMHAVFGNNDGDKVFLARKGEGFCTFSDGVCRVNLDGRRIIMMHYPDVAEDLYRLGCYDLVIHGHDHKARVEGAARKLLNPGTCSGYLADRASIALVDTADMAVELASLP